MDSQRNSSSHPGINPAPIHLLELTDDALLMDDALMDDEWAEPPSREEQLEMTTESHEGAMGMVDVVRRLRRAVQTLAVPARARCSLGDLARLVVHIP